MLEEIINDINNDPVRYEWIGLMMPHQLEAQYRATRNIDEVLEHHFVGLENINAEFYTDPTKFGWIGVTNVHELCRLYGIR